MSYKIKKWPWYLCKYEQIKHDFESFLLVFFFNSFLFLLALNLTVFFLILCLLFSNNFFVLLIFCHKTVLGSLIDIRPHIANDPGDFGDFGCGIVGLDLFIDLSTIEEESWECSFGSRWLCIIKVTLSDCSFLPIIKLLIVPVIDCYIWLQKSLIMLSLI